MSGTAAQLYCAVDTADLDAARRLVGDLAAHIDGIKLGLEFFCAHGPEGVKHVLGDSELPLFLDLKLHDIPNTVAAAVRAAAISGPAMLTVHAGGGAPMLRAAVAAAAALDRPPKLLAVTILTSLDPDDLTAIGMHADLRGQVLRLARMAVSCGIDGVVCSPEEVGALRHVVGDNVTLVTPGIRPSGAAVQDQKRAASPKQAVADGADVLVVGRPITQADNPAAAAAAIKDEMKG